MPDREPITIEKIPVLLASLMRDIDELHGSIDSMNVADYYNRRLHRINV